MMSIDCPNAENRTVIAGVAAVNDIIHTSLRTPAAGVPRAVLNTPGAASSIYMTFLSPRTVLEMSGTTQNGNIYLFTALKEGSHLNAATVCMRP
jgi:hypothetical protein